MENPGLRNSLQSHALANYGKPEAALRTSAQVSLYRNAMHAALNQPGAKQ
jgi:hypothetical protein